MRTLIFGLFRGIASVILSCVMSVGIIWTLDQPPLTQAQSSIVQTPDAMPTQHVPHLVLPLPISTITLASESYPEGIGVNPDTGFAYVVNVGTHNIAVLSNTQVLTTVAAGSHVIPGNENLVFGIGVNLLNGYTYIPTRQYNEVAILSGSQVITYLPVFLGKEYFAPYPVAVHPASGSVYIPVSQNLLVLSGTEVITTVFFSSGVLKDVAVNPATGYIYVVDQCCGMYESYGNVHILSGTEPITSFRISTLPYHVAVHPFNSYAYVVHNSGSLMVFSGTELLSNVATTSTFPSILANPTNGYIYLADSDNDQVIVVSGIHVIATIPVGSWPIAMAVNPLSGYVYVVNRDSDDVTVLNGTQTIRTVPVGRNPSAIGINPSTGLVYVANFLDHSISVLQEITPSHQILLPLIAQSYQPSEDTPLTFDPSNDTQPALSPDGSEIAFTSWRTGTPQIYSVNLDGTGLITWTTRSGWEADQPRLAHDGRRLVYAARSLSSTFDIFTRPFATDYNP